MIKKICNFKFVFRNYQAGMTYVELIVVLSIFSVMTSIVLFDYNKFQAQVDIKVLANDIALKIVEAQKSSISGKLPLLAIGYSIDPTWKPSYGVNFFSTVNNNKSFTYFANYPNCTGENCTDMINITKGNFISKLDIIGPDCPTSTLYTNLNVLFKRPDSSAVITAVPAYTCSISYAQITVSSPTSVTSKIKIYPFGRIQIN